MLILLPEKNMYLVCVNETIVNEIVIFEYYYKKLTSTLMRHGSMKL